MGRFVIGLVVGAMGAAAIYAMNESRYTLLAPLVGIACGLLIGALLGWRNPQPGQALVSGLLVGAMAGFLIGVGQFISVSDALHTSRAPIWLRHVSQYSALFGWVSRGMGGLLILLVASIAGSLAGVLSAWTGYGRNAGRLPTPDDAFNLLPGPAE